MKPWLRKLLGRHANRIVGLVLMAIGAAMAWLGITWFAGPLFSAANIAQIEGVDTRVRPGYIGGRRRGGTNMAAMRSLRVLAFSLLACAGNTPPRAELLEGSVGAGAWIYPEVLARVIGPETAGEPAARPQLVYLSRSLCNQGEPDPALRLGPEIQQALTQSAQRLGREARWVDSRAVFGHAEAADSGDVLVCFEPIELSGALAHARVSLESRDGSREPAAYAFAYRDGRWVMESEDAAR